MVPAEATRLNPRSVSSAARDVYYRSVALHGLIGQSTRSLVVVITDVTTGGIGLGSTAGVSGTVITLAPGLAIGRLVFHALNLAAEVALTATLTAAGATSLPPRSHG